MSYWHQAERLEFLNQLLVVGCHECILRGLGIV
jgi:hypothetical protein